MPDTLHDSGPQSAADILAMLPPALAATDRLLAAVRDSLLPLVAPDGRPDRELMTTHQTLAHGYAWAATLMEALRRSHEQAQALERGGRFGALERLALLIGSGEYLGQIAGGIPMSQTETIRLTDFGLPAALIGDYVGGPAGALIRQGNSAAHRWDFSQLLAGGAFPDDGLDETLSMVRDSFRRFADDHKEAAHGWHLKDELIPMDVIAALAAMGVFGLTIPERLGGSGMGKMAMCVVSEELSRGYIGLGSLGTRSEIAAELIMGGGDAEQKARWLPGLASGAILPTAVFTEPDTGSDLANLKTRAVRDGDVYRVSGAKTWITHAARADLMTLLVRTGPAGSGHKGLSMLIAEKPRGSGNDPFPAKGMSGSEIGVLGYRGMKEYEIGFDDFIVPAGNLLGHVEGEGFRQLMATFESARIQTAARAIGVARSAFELGLAYARQRRQFGRPILDFPRVHGKLAVMAAEIMMVRALSYHGAQAKDGGRRCDLEAGMAKLLAARVAWAAADTALQIHGGNGYALEYPISRVLVDARILNVFEGAAEIQAQVIASRLLEG